MIQRKQTLFLLLAVIVIAICLCLPIASFSPKTMGSDSLLYNLGISYEGGMGTLCSLKCVPMFLLLSLSACIALVSIFLYDKRKLELQKKLCSVAMFLILLWYVGYAMIWGGWIVPMPDALKPRPELFGAFHFRFAACLPLVALVLLTMAKKGVNDDIKLLKAADRIR